MDDPIIFTAFLQRLCGLTVARNRNEMVSFIDTFTALLSTSDTELDDFVKNTHATNSARAAAQKILIPTSTVVTLKAIRFELHDRNRCGVLPDAAMLNALTAIQMNYLKVQRTKAIQDKVLLSAIGKLPEITVPKLTSSNYESFTLAFKAVVTQTIGMNGTPIDHVLRTITGNYDLAWPSRNEKLAKCLLLTGSAFRADSATLFSLYLQYIGTDGIGSNIVNKYISSKNGRNCHLDFESHYRNAAYLANKASAATMSMNNALYNGDRRNFSLETYYTVMCKAFNDLEDAGIAHALNDVKKVTAFEGGLKDPQAIQWCIISRERWDNFPIADQTFDRFYNEFSKYISKVKTLTIGSGRSSKIGALGTQQGRGRGRGRGRGGRGRHGRGQGRGRGRGRGNNPYSLSRPFTGGANFVPEAKIYERDEYKKLSADDQHKIVELKAAAGWINGYTPPHGFTLDNNGYATPSTSLVSAVQAHISQTSTSSGAPGTWAVGTPLPPHPGNNIPPIPPIINTDPHHAGNAFGRRGSRHPPEASSQISAVSINGRSYNGSIFDANGNRIA